MSDTMAVVTAVSFLILVWVVALVRWRAAKRGLSGRPSFHDVPWTLADLCLFALTFVAFSTTAAVVIVGTDELKMPDEDRGAWTMAASFLAQVIGAGAVLVLLLTLRRVRPDHLGLNRRRTGNPVVFGLSAYLVFAPLVLLAQVLNHRLLDWFGQDFEIQEVVRVMLEKVRPSDGNPADPLLISVFVVSTVVVVPICEEFLFRGLLLGGLRRWLPPVPAILLSSYMFALAHSISLLVPIFALALILGAVYDRTRSLPAVIAMHGLHNGLMVLGMFVAPMEG